LGWLPQANAGRALMQDAKRLRISAGSRTSYVTGLV
jgi:hypothetical protein